jgi:signal transduction histidine kinase
MNLSVFYSIDFYIVSALINFITSLILGILIYLENRKENINQVFTLFAFSVSVWSLGYVFWQISSSAEDALFWSRFFMGAAIFTAPTYFHFVYSFIKKYYPISRKIFYWIYGVATLFFVVDFLPTTKDLFVSKVEPELFFSFWPKPGGLYHIFLFLWISCLVYAAYILVKTYRKVKIPVLKRQLSFILVAMIIAFVSGSTNYFLWYGIPILPFANICVSLYVLILGYAVLKHNLFNIKAVATDFLVIIQILILLIRAVLTEGTTEKIINFSILGVSIVIGAFLIRAIEGEIKSRNKIEELASHLEEANEKLKSLDKLKSEFVSLASHQLRSPLTVIKGYASTLTDGIVGDLTDKQKEIVRHIYAAAQGLASVVEDFLNVTKIEQGGMKYVFAPTDVKAIFLDLASDMKIAAEDRHLTFTSEIDESQSFMANADGTKIKQVFLNLVDNSIKYTKEGFVKVKIVRDTEKRTMTFSVSDSGVGISPETKEKLFTKFGRGEGAVLNGGGVNVRL